MPQYFFLNWLMCYFSVFRFQKNKIFNFALECQNKRIAGTTEDFRRMQDGKPIKAVTLQSSINLYLSTHDKDFLTFTAQNTTEK